MTVNTSSSPTKKRKVNDGRDDVPDSTHDVSNDGGGFFSSWFGYFSGRGDGALSERNSKTQLDRMEQMMMRMEDKLATVSSLESRCEQLEAKCSSLESKLESTSQLLTSTSQSVKDHVDRKIDSLRTDLDQKCSSLEHNRLESKVDSLQDMAHKYHAYNVMLARNQSWKYSPVIDSYGWQLDNHDETEYLLQKAYELKFETLRMRRGEFPHDEDGDCKDIYLYVNANFADVVNEHLLSHLKEFISALKQFTPAMNLLPDDYKKKFEVENLKLNQDTKVMMKDALIGKPFTEMSFTHNTSTNVDFESGGMSADDIVDIIHSNKHLRRLTIRHNCIQSTHVDRLCNIVHNYPLVELDLWNSINDSTIGNAMLTSLLTSGDLKLETLRICRCNITSDVIPLLADFIATNPRLKELDLSDNDLNDNDASLIANALRSNTTLRKLRLGGNDDITDDGVRAAFWPVLCDKSSLNAVADSNHCCIPRTSTIYFIRNSSDVSEENRGRKIYSLLCERQLCETMSNVQHFRDIDVKVLPNLLEAVQRYSTIESKDDKDDPGLKVGSLSIVYEVMRKWDKVFSIYTSEDVE